MPSQRDYNVLVKFSLINKVVTRTICDIDGKLIKKCNNCLSFVHMAVDVGSKIIAMVASARPVQVKVTPSESIDFGCCVSGKSTSKDFEVCTWIHG